MLPVLHFCFDMAESPTGKIRDRVDIFIVSGELNLLLPYNGWTSSTVSLLSENDTSLTLVVTPKRPVIPSFPTQRHLHRVPSCLSSGRGFVWFLIEHKDTSLYLGCGSRLPRRFSFTYVKALHNPISGSSLGHHYSRDPIPPLVHPP
jgi:hypothetical protein